MTATFAALAGVVDGALPLTRMDPPVLTRRDPPGGRAV